MFAPDPIMTQQALQQTISASAVMTVYAGSMRYVVAPRLAAATFPGWFDPVRAAIDRAVADARGWMDDLCIDVTSSVPRSVIGFARSFEQVADAMINLQTEIAMGAGIATPAQRQQAIERLKTLGRDISGVLRGTEAIEARLLDLVRLVQADHDALAEAGQSLARNIPDGATISHEIRADLGSDFLNITPNGPCRVAIDIKSEVMLRIAQTAGNHPELLPYILAQAVIDNALDDNARATGAMSQMMAVWSLMSGLVETALVDLAEAGDPEVLDILRMAEFDAARQVWDNLARVADSLIEHDGTASIEGTFQ